MARLTVESGEEKGREFKIAVGEMTIGRLKTNAVAIQDPMSSREHTRVAFDGNVHSVQDLGSRNGTYVNTHQMKGGDPRPLAHGDKIQIGRTVLIFLEDPEDVERRKKAEAAAAAAAPVSPSHAHALQAVHEAAALPGLPAAVHYLILAAVFAGSLMASKILFDAVLATVQSRPAAGRR